MVKWDNIRSKRKKEGEGNGEGGGQGGRQGEEGEG